MGRAMLLILVAIMLVGRKLQLAATLNSACYRRVMGVARPGGEYFRHIVLIDQQVVLPDALYTVSIRLGQLSLPMGHSKLPFTLVDCVVRPYHLSKAMPLVLEEATFVASTRRPFLIARTLGLPFNQVSCVVDLFHQFSVGWDDFRNQPISFAVHFSLQELAVITLTAWQG